MPVDEELKKCYLTFHHHWPVRHISFESVYYGHRMLLCIVLGDNTNERHVDQRIVVGVLLLFQSAVPHVPDRGHLALAF
jgi:hypothetical protein